MTEPHLTADPQTAVIDFLSCPASYGLRDERVEQIETHCSIVFLAADRAYKLKRAIRFASLDYTTEAARHRACESELLLNRRTAPDIYLAVRSINRDANGAMSFDGPGTTLDHVVVMRRFAQSDLFDHLADSGRLTPTLMQALGQSIARFHAEAEVTPMFGGSAAIRRVIADNDRELALVAATLNGTAVSDLSGRTKIELEAVAPLLDQRRAEGRVRRCHGDLRLANICLYEDRPTLFDCIEFSEEIGCIDVLYDLAFLLMDLHLHGRGDLGNAVFNAYCDHAGEIIGLRPLPLFLSLRAATRSYALAGGAQRRANPRQAARLLLLARRHIAAASSFLTAQAPMLIVLGGGDCRTRCEMANMLAALMAPAPGARVLHRGSSGEAAWREAFDVLEAGCSVMFEGVFTQNDERNAVIAQPSPVQVLLFWLGPLPPTLDHRIWRPLDASKGVLTAVASAAPFVSMPGAQSQVFERASS